ncbi:helix-turn-helix domain-containing protein [Halomicrobium salinisoli]|uniref:helix-turn-helix domain-containing protein n=1 Tax=Halomicrobium salinisoli TaxID=2878391 RepID=UPI001CEFC932|nr:helix-turn-helix domain-containing protein [Halomicrobium salinisoli]
MAVTMEIAVDDPGSCPVARASESAGDVTSVQRASIAGDGPVTEEFTAAADAPVDDGDLEQVATAGDEAVYRFEREAGSACVCQSIEELAGPVSDVRAADGGLVVTARVDDVETVRSVVDRLRDAFDGVRIRRLRSLDEATDGDGLAPDGLLTERQREVLETAHDLGYFEYPKGANAGEVADELGISRSTLAEHLAAAQGKLLATMLDSGDRGRA